MIFNKKISILHSNSKKAMYFLINSEASKQSLIMTAGNFITAAIMGLTMIVLSRFIGPSQFGIFSVGMSLMFIFTKFVDAGLDQLIPRFLGIWNNEADKKRIFLAYVLWWKILFGGLLLLAGLISVNWLSKMLNYPYPSMIIYSVLGAILFALYNYVYMVLSAQHKFIQVGVLSVAQALFKAISFILIIWLWSSNLEAITLSYYLAPFIMALIFLVFFNNDLFVRPSLIKNEETREINRFWGHAAFGVLMLTLIANIDVLLVQKYLDSFSTGIYAGAIKISSFIGMLTASIGGVLNNRVSRYKDKSTLMLYLKKSTVLIAFAVVGFLLFLPLSKAFVAYTIGPEYLSGVSALILLVLNAFLSMLLIPLAAIFYSVDEPSYFSINGIIQVIVIFSVSLLFLPQFGIMAVAWSRVFATLVSLFYTLICLKVILKKIK
jgi:O-antigen/teichoic acid export membrane protein